MTQLSFRLSDFEGPLDLLLHLISKHKLNIYDTFTDEILYEYEFGDLLKDYYLKDEKDSQRKWEMFFDGGKFEGVSKIEPDGTDYSTWYSDGQPSQISKYKYYSDNNSEEMEYLPEYKEYSVSKVLVNTHTGVRCERCWNRFEANLLNSLNICPRCEKAMKKVGF